MLLPVFALAQDDGEWRMPAKDYASTRYSRLAEINAANVGSLREVWSFTTGIERGHEAAPIVAGGTIFIVTPWPNTVIALDMRGSLKWKFEPKTNPSAQGVACCDVVNRGAFYEGGRLFFKPPPNPTIPVHAQGGQGAPR